jgi:hypothetical protein
MKILLLLILFYLFSISIAILVKIEQYNENDCKSAPNRTIFIYWNRCNTIKGNSFYVNITNRSDKGTYNIYNGASCRILSHSIPFVLTECTNVDGNSYRLSLVPSITHYWNPQRNCVLFESIGSVYGAGECVVSDDNTKSFDITVLDQNEGKYNLYDNNYCSGQPINVKAFRNKECFELKFISHFFEISTTFEEKQYSSVKIRNRHSDSQEKVFRKIKAQDFKRNKASSLREPVLEVQYSDFPQCNSLISYSHYFFEDCLYVNATTSSNLVLTDTKGTFNCFVGSRCAEKPVFEIPFDYQCYSDFASFNIEYYSKK